MQDRTFDRLTRTLAAQPTRRGFLRGLGALAAAGLATTAFGQRRTFNQAMAGAADDPEEQMVMVFEEIGRIAHEHVGSCKALAKKTRDFQEKYNDLIEQMRAEEATWTAEHRATHADKYGERRLAVVERVTAARSRCDFAIDAAGMATPLASPAALGMFAPAIAGTRPATVHRFANQDATCTPDNFNFIPAAYCAKYDSDWTSSSFQWPAYCPSGNLDGSCDLCQTSASYPTIPKTEMCSHWWPNDCLGGDGQDLCEVKYHQSHGGIAGAICDSADQSKVLQNTHNRCYSNDSGWHSPEFTWNQYCPKGYVDHDCIDCQTVPWAAGITNPGVCTHYWPQDCYREPGRNICYVGFHVDDTGVCCNQNYPVKTTGCVLSAFESLGDDAECGACMLSWCGSTSNCLEHCESEGCCDDPCSSDYVPTPPGGEGKTAGTPIPLGSPTTAPATPPPASPPAIPTTAPTAIPTTAPTSAPTSVPTVPPTAVPTTIPTNVPTTVPTK